MHFISFYDGKAVAQTAWVKHGLEETRNIEGVEVEAHDDWPEKRTHDNLLNYTFSNLPDNVGNLTVEKFMKLVKPH